jgi:long-chain fatty acid transport protein
VSIGAGVIWQPRKDVWIGLSYQSQPGFGEMSMEGTLTNKFGTAPASTSDVRIEQSLPDVFRLGARFRPTPEVELRVFGDYVRWSTFERQCIVETDGNCALTETGAAAPEAAGIAGVLPRDWHDAFGVRAGASYWFTPALEAFVGGGYDSNAVPDKTLEPSFIDMDKVSASLGARIGLMNGRMALLATFNHIFYFERTVDARPRDGDGDPISPYEPPSRVPDGAGTYTHAVTALNMGVEFSF